MIRGPYSYLMPQSRFIPQPILFVSLGLFIFAEPMVTMLMGPQFQNAVSVLKWMAFMPLLVGVSNVFGIQTMLAFNMKREFSRIIVSCGLLNLLILIPLVRVFAAEGAAISVLVTEIAVTASMALVLSKTSLLGQLLKG